MWYGISYSINLLKPARQDNRNLSLEQPHSALIRRTGTAQRRDGLLTTRYICTCQPPPASSATDRRNNISVFTRQAPVSLLDQRCRPISLSSRHTKQKSKKASPWITPMWTWRPPQPHGTALWHQAPWTAEAWTTAAWATGAKSPC